MRYYAALPLFYDALPLLPVHQHLHMCSGILKASYRAFGSLVDVQLSTAS